MALKDVGDGCLLDGQQFAIVNEGIGEEIDEVFFRKRGENAVVSWAASAWALAASLTTRMLTPHVSSSFPVICATSA